MKKNFLMAAALAMVAGFSACKSSSSSSSFENDVRKRADYMCKIQQLTAKAGTDQKAAKDLEDVKKELEKYDEDMTKKYKDKKPDDKMSAQSTKIIEDVMAKCK